MHQICRRRRVWGAENYRVLPPAAIISFVYISGVLPEKARLDVAGIAKYTYVKLIYCYQSSLKAFHHSTYTSIMLSFEFKSFPSLCLH